MNLIEMGEEKLGLERSDIIRNYCPSKVRDDLIGYELSTLSNKGVDGCRGITCERCWNMSRLESAAFLKNYNDKKELEYDKMDKCRFEPGNIVQHFKRETIDNPDNEYLYKFLCVAIHTETKEKFAIYQACYPTQTENGEIMQIYARPYDMFMAEVDHDKYPNIKQKYRFEKFVPNKDK